VNRIVRPVAQMADVMRRRVCRLRDTIDDRLESWPGWVRHLLAVGGYALSVAVVVLGGLLQTGVLAALTDMTAPPAPWVGIAVAVQLALGGAVVIVIMALGGRPAGRLALRLSPGGRRLLLVGAVLVAAVAILLVAAGVASAGPAPAPAPAPAPVPAVTDLNQVITNARNWLVGILAGAATLVFSVGGLRYLGAHGDPAEIERAKGAFKAAAVGYGLAILAPVLLTALRSVVGG